MYLMNRLILWIPDTFDGNCLWGYKYWLLDWCDDDLEIFFYA